jgi:hypothetical protein
MSTSTPPTPFEFGATVTFDEVRDCIPQCLLALSDKGPELLGLAPPVVAIAGLAHLGACFGRSLFVEDGCSRIHACFNLAVISDSLLTHDWLSNIGQGWINAADRLQTTDLENVKTAIVNGVREIAAQRTDHEFRSNDPQFEAMQKTIPLSFISMLRRKTIISNLDPGAVTRAVVDSRDQCVTLLQGASDPMDEWANMPAGKQRELAEIIMLSWRCKHLRLPPHNSEVPATVHLLWTVRADAARHMLFGRRSSLSQSPLPVLFIHQKGTPKRLPDNCANEFSNWSKCLANILSHRVVVKDIATLDIDDPSRKIVEEFFEQFANALLHVPQPMHRYLSWLPDLVLRLYSIITMTKAIAETRLYGVAAAPAKEPTPDRTKLRQVAMAKAVRLTVWLCQEHYQVVQGLMTDALSVAGFCDTDSTDNTDSLELAEAVFLKLQSQGPKTARELQRCFHHLSAGERNQAIARLKMAGRVVENGAGQLEAAA